MMGLRIESFDVLAGMEEAECNSGHHLMRLRAVAGFA